MSRKKTTEEFKKDVYELVGNEYTVLGEYINARTKILIRHNTCDTEYYVKPNNFLQNHRCSKCFKNNKKTTEEFKKDIYDLVGNEYTVLGEYINNYTKILMKHNLCNTEYYVVPYSFLRGHRCPFCNGNNKKNIVKIK